jgi:hypothetical protein
MKPGDLIEWVFKRNSQPVDEDAELWSTTMKRWAPIGAHPMMLISMTDEFYMWLTPKGLFHAHPDDTPVPIPLITSTRVVPRAWMTQTTTCEPGGAKTVIPRDLSENIDETR